MNKRHIFILNPAAGQGRAFALEEEIISTGRRLGVKTEIYKTKEVLDAQVEAVRFAKTASLESPVRIYACGGDGTVNEVLNGIAGYENVELAIVPTGTGNDFIRNFGTSEDFLNIERQILGKPVKVDIIGYRSSTGGYSVKRYCINMLNMGFDCNVVAEAANLKKLPLVSGSLAYLIGVAKNLYRMKGTDLKVEFEDGSVYDGKLLLMSIANGCYCGGGVKGAPYAVPDDGFMDVSLIKRVSRTRFISMFPKYVKGTHLETKAAGRFIKYVRARKLTVTTNGEKIFLSTDGEITETGRLELEVFPKAVNFSVPSMGNL